MINKDFFAALDALEKEKGISSAIFIEALRNALLAAYKRQYSPIGTIDIKLNAEKGSLEFYAIKDIVEEVVDREKEISLEEAQKVKKSYKLGEKFCEKFTPKDFSRIAAQTAKQVILQKLHETERDAAVNEFSDKEGELLVGIVRKKDEKAVYIEFGKGQVEGLLMAADQVPGETYNVNDKIKVYIKKVKNGFRGAQVLVSRSSTGLVRKLFESEVPEIKLGTIVIKEISREAGGRTKVAIHSQDPRIDAVGACVGNKGARVNAIVQELHGEKIDIIPWSENPLEFIAKALLPAKVLFVTQIDEKSARVVVPDDKLSLAIGKDGQNARLAVKLTGWKIDVKSETQAKKAEESENVEFDEDLLADINASEVSVEDNEVENLDNGD